MNIIGIDLGKTVFHLVMMDPQGKVTGRKKLSRPQMLTYLANVPRSLVAMEASCGAHHLSRHLAEQGHEVRLIPAQFVRPFVKSQKNDYVDAEAIAEAVQRPTMRFVAIKTEDQLDLQALHRVREPPSVPNAKSRSTTFLAITSCSMWETGILSFTHISNPGASRSK